MNTYPDEDEDFNDDEISLPWLSAPANVRGVQPHGGEAVPRVRQAKVGVLAGPAQRHSFDVLLAIVLPHDADHGRHRLAERVPRNLRLKGVEDALASGPPGRRRLDILHPASVEQMFA